MTKTCKKLPRRALQLVFLPKTVQHFFFIIKKKCHKTLSWQTMTRFQTVNPGRTWQTWVFYSKNNSTVFHLDYFKTWQG